MDYGDITVHCQTTPHCEVRHLMQFYTTQHAHWPDILTFYSAGQNYQRVRLAWKTPFYTAVTYTLLMVSFVVKSDWDRNGEHTLGRCGKLWQIGVVWDDTISTHMALNLKSLLLNIRYAVGIFAQGQRCPLAIKALIDHLNPLTRAWWSL